jgi:hypothetical protein
MPGRLDRRSRIPPHPRFEPMTQRDLYQRDLYQRDLAAADACEAAA